MWGAGRGEQRASPRQRQRQRRGSALPAPALVFVCCGVQFVLSVLFNTSDRRKSASGRPFPAEQPFPSAQSRARVIVVW